MPNFSSLARLEVPEKFLWVGGVCTVIFVSNPTVVLRCVGVGVLTIVGFPGGWGVKKVHKPYYCYVFLVIKP